MPGNADAPSTHLAVVLAINDIPQLITRVEQFMTDMEPLLAKIKKSKQPHSAVSTPNSPTCSWTGAENSSTSHLPDDLKDKVRIGTEVSLTKRSLSNCNHMDPGKLTGDLMMAVFGRQLLLSSSLTGMKNKEGKTKPPLKNEQVADIIGYVRSKFPAASPQFVRQIMTNKLSNEAKRERSLKKKLDQVNDEKIPESGKEEAAEEID